MTDVQQARLIAETLLGRSPDRLEPFRPTVGGDDSWSFRLWRGTEQLLLKIKRRSGTPVGVYFHSRVKEAGVPVPGLVAFDPAAGAGGEACAVWGWIDGVPATWGGDQSCPYDEAELGRILRRIHDLEFDGDFGFFGDDPSRRAFSYTPDLPPTSPTWTGFFGCERAAKRYFDKGYLSRREADVLAGLPQRLERELGAAPRRLLHMSDIMHNGNMILHRETGRILAVVDYVESMAGDPRWELAWFDFYFEQCPYGRSRFDLRRFREAYGTEHDPNDSLGRFYLACALLFEKLLYFKPTEPRGKWAIRTLKDILRELAGT